MGTCSTRDLTSGHPNLWCQNLWGHVLCLSFAACLPTVRHYCNPLTEQFSAQSYRSNLLFSERIPAWWSTVIDRWWTKTSKAFWSILPNYRWIITLQWSWRWNACETGSKCGRGFSVNRPDLDGHVKIRSVMTIYRVSGICGNTIKHSELYVFTIYNRAIALTNADTWPGLFFYLCICCISHFCYLLWLMLAFSLSTDVGQFRYTIVHSVTIKS